MDSYSLLLHLSLLPYIPPSLFFSESSLSLCLSIICYQTQHGQSQLHPLQLHFSSPASPSFHLSITSLSFPSSPFFLSFSLFSFSLSVAHHRSPESLQSISVWEAFIFRATPAKWEGNGERERERERGGGRKKKYKWSKKIKERKRAVKGERWRDDLRGEKMKGEEMERWVR